MKLNDSKIRAATFKVKPYKLSDGKGLVLLVHPNGSKYWRFNYRFAGKAKSLSIGTYPGVSLAKAREKRKDAKNLLRDQIDPSAEKRKEKRIAYYRDRNSFHAIAEEWKERNLSRWSARHADRTWARLENHVLPQLGRRPVTDIRPIDVLALVQKIEQDGNFETAHRVLAICRSVFRYAVITARLEHNPTDNLTGALKAYRKNHYPTLRSQELPDFLKALDVLQASEQKKIAFHLLLHTAVRTGELRHAQWNEIDFERKEWVIPASKTKMEREHLVPLSRQSLSKLQRLHLLTGEGEWLFPNRRGFKHPMMHENAINDMIEEMGYRGRIVGHGCRSLFSTVLNEMSSFSMDAIERQLAHVERNAVRAAYNRAEYLDERRKMMQWWSDFLADQVAPKSLAGANVVSIFEGSN